MRPHYNRPQQQQQNNGYPNQQDDEYPNQQDNGYHQNMMNRQMMNPGMMMMNPRMMMMPNPMMMGNQMMNNMPPMHPPFFNNMPQQQQQQFGFPSPINIPNLLGTLQYAAAAANNNFMGGGCHPMPQPTYYQPPGFPPQPQLNNSYKPPPPTPQQHQNHQSGPPGFSQAPRPQVQSVGNVNNTNNFNSNGNDYRNKFTKQQNFRGPGQGSQSYQGDNAKKKFGLNKGQKGKKNNKKMVPRVYGSDAGIAEETKRPYIPNYPPKEVQQWRQARRKNFPTKLNVEKKVKKNDPNCSLDEEAKLRRQQLREVLAKQRELGVEVAEVPSHYLSNPVEEVGNNDGQFENKDGKKGRFRHNKRKYGGKGKFNKKRKFQDSNSSEESSVTTREPTLLEKLLSADIKRDKIQLLQVIRFMAMNSFFKESSEEPLRFPLVMVEETGCEHAEEVLSDDDSDDDDVDENSDDESCDEASD